MAQLGIAFRLIRTKRKSALSLELSKPPRTNRLTRFPHEIVAMEKNEPRAPYPISTELYRWETTGWKRYVP